MSMILIKEKINSLIEGRFEDAANANQDYANELMKLKSGGLKPKYIDWVLKQFKDGSLKKENNVALDYVLNNLKLFETCEVPRSERICEFVCKYSLEIRYSKFEIFNQIKIFKIRNVLFTNSTNSD
jgi:hypothetical protein